MANRNLAAIRKLFNWCLSRDVIQVSPCTLIDVTPERSRDRVLSDDEMRLVWNAADGDGWPYGALIKLLMLTGQRLAEVGEMRWDEIDLKNKLWTLPPERVKNGQRHEVPLSDMVIEIIGAMPRVETSRNFVFATTRDAAVSGFSRCKHRTDAAVAAALPEGKKAPDPWVFHDLREDNGKRHGAARRQSAGDRKNIEPHQRVASEVSLLFISVTPSQTKSGARSICGARMSPRSFRAITKPTLSTSPPFGGRSGRAAPVDAVTAFGPLPDDARLKLAKELENAWGLSQNFGFDPAKARVVFQRIAVAAENLLGTLFVDADDISRAFDEQVDLGTALGPLRTAYEASFVERRRAAGFKPAGHYPPGARRQARFEHAARVIPLERLAVPLADLATGARYCCGLSSTANAGRPPRKRSQGTADAACLHNLRLDAPRASRERTKDRNGKASGEFYHRRTFWRGVQGKRCHTGCCEGRVPALETEAQAKTSRSIEMTFRPSKCRDLFSALSLL